MLKKQHNLFIHWKAQGGASFRRADAAQICNNGSFILEGDGPTECSVATAARQIVSERW